MVMTFVLHPLSHYNFITEPRAQFLLSLFEDLSIDFPSHFILSFIDVYKDTATRDKLIFPSVITRILCYLLIPLPDSPFFPTMGAISAASVRRSEAQLQPKQPRMETTIPPAPSTPSISTPSLTGGVTFKAIIVMLECMDAHLDIPNDELCQMNTCVGRITRRQAQMGGFVASHSPSPEALANEDADDGTSADDGTGDDDEDEDANSSSNDEMTIS